MYVKLSSLTERRGQAGGPDVHDLRSCLRNKHGRECRAGLAAVLLLAAASIATAAGVSPLDPVQLISQSEYQAAQLAVQNMGLGLYGGMAYNQGYRNRYNAGGSALASLGFQEANLYLRDRYGGLGLAVTQQSDYQNVVAELPGTETPDRIFIIGAHYDHRNDNAEAPGGDDNASGSAAVLEAARVLGRYQFKSTLRFVNWGGEEGRMLGSWDYARNVIKPNSDPAHHNLVGLLNLDMVLRPGWDSQPSHPIDLDVGTRLDKPACVAWANAFRTAAARYAPSLTLAATHGDWYPSDQGPFMYEEAGFLYPGLVISENTPQQIWRQGSNAYYHTAEDASDRMANNPHNPSGIVYDYGFATDVVRAAVGMLAEQAEIVGLRPAVWSGSAAGDVRWSTAANWGGMALFAGAPLKFGTLSGGHAASQNDLPAGTAFGGITLASALPEYDLGGNPIQLAGPVVNQGGGAQSLSLGLQLAAGGGEFDIGGGSVTVSGPISGAGPLVKTGGGELVLAGENTYSGGTTVFAGTLLVSSVFALPDGKALTVAAGATVVLQKDLNVQAPSGAAIRPAASSSMASVPEPSALTLVVAGAVVACLWFRWLPR
jgi:autotransporter-associated beta strand protein